MRIANVAGRSTLISDTGAGLDVEKASNGSFPADMQALYEQWNQFRTWADRNEHLGDLQVDPEDLGPPTPSPRQIFAIGLNYVDHVSESQLSRPESPAVFTKFLTSIAGPNAKVNLPSENVDWEVELVVAIGRRAYEVSERDAWQHVAGLTVGQDLSERVVQLAGPAPQFSLGKSFPGFAPLGPSLVTVDAFEDPDDLELGCRIDDEVLQLHRTKGMIFSVPELIARLSAVCPLLPGDIIFTGTPAGVGQARTPKRFLTPGSTLISHIQGIGELHTECVAGPHHPAFVD